MRRSPENSKRRFWSPPSQFGKTLPIEDYHTIGGYVFGLLGRAPEHGDEVGEDGLRFKVVELEGSRIDRLEVEFDPERDRLSEPPRAAEG